MSRPSRLVLAILALVLAGCGGATQQTAPPTSEAAPAIDREARQRELRIRRDLLVAAAGYMRCVEGLELDGNLTLDVTVEPDGRITRATVTGNELTGPNVAQAQAVGECIAANLRALQVEPSQSGKPLELSTDVALKHVRERAEGAQTGKLTKLDVSATIRGGFGHVRVCSKNADVTGTLYGRMTLEPDGTASNVRVVSKEFIGSQVGQCVVEVVEDLRFPTHTHEPILVTYPFQITH